MKPDAMNHIDQWSSGGEGSINTDPNSIKVSNTPLTKLLAVSNNTDSKSAKRIILCMELYPGNHDCSH